VEFRIKIKLNIFLYRVLRFFSENKIESEKNCDQLWKKCKKSKNGIKDLKTVESLL